MRKFLYHIFGFLGIFVMLFGIIINATFHFAFAASDETEVSQIQTADVATGIPTTTQKAKMDDFAPKTAEITTKSGVKTASKAAKSTPAAKKCAGNDNEPVRIIISSLGLDKCIQKEFLNNNAMHTPDNLPAFLAPTAYGNKNVNENGNTFIYGHNKSGIFGNLGQIKNGAKIELELGNGTRISYTVNLGYSHKNFNYYCINTTTCAENLTMTNIIAQKHGAESLSIMTCAGAYDPAIATNNARHIIVAIRD